MDVPEEQWCHWFCLQHKVCSCKYIRNVKLIQMWYYTTVMFCVCTIHNYAYDIYKLYALERKYLICNLVTYNYSHLTYTVTTCTTHFNINPTAITVFNSLVILTNWGNNLNKDLNLTYMNPQKTQIEYLVYWIVDLTKTPIKSVCI